MSKHDEETLAKLTAYAVGELGEGESAEVEALLAGDEEARGFVDEMRALDGVLGEHLGPAEGPGLTDEQKERIAAAAAPDNVIRPAWQRPSLATIGVAAAALIAIGLVATRPDGKPKGLDLAGGGSLEAQLAQRQWELDNAPGRERETEVARTAAGSAEDSRPVADASREQPRVGGNRSQPRTPAPAASQPGPAEAVEDTDEGRRGGGYRGPAGEIPPDARAPHDPAAPTATTAPQSPGGPESGSATGPADEVTAAPQPPPKPAPTRPGYGATGEGGTIEVAGRGPVAGGGDGAGASGKKKSRRVRGSGLVADMNDARFDRSGRPADRTIYVQPSGESYDHPGEAVFRNPVDAPLSTFSIDVDTASYTNVRRFLNEGRLPPPAAVRVEEMVNYFQYDYAEPKGDRPIGASVEVAGCPWNTHNRLVRIGVKAADPGEAPGPANLVFLVDVSGSMRPDNKLPLLRQGLRMMVERMTQNDRVAIVTYASQSGVHLQSTNGAERTTIAGAIDTLAAGGSTNGGSGIQMAYDIAAQHFVKGGVNRVVLATDGDFNVGVTDRNELIRLIQQKAKTGVFLSVLGLGTGNIKDATLEQIANKGNGHYAYLDSLRECRKVLVDEMRSTFITVAKDVKIQVEFNPAKVRQYRLVGYENRVLAARDFNDDTKDAGEMGAGHTVTALYEVVPSDAPAGPGVDPLRYQPRPAQPVRETTGSTEMLTLKVRYKLPEASESSRFDIPVTDSKARYSAASRDFKFAAGVAAFGLLLRNSPSAGNTSYDAILELAGEALGEDPRGYRTEFLDLVRKAKQLSGR